MEFYQIISKKYQQILLVFKFDYLDITDYLLTKNINKNRHHDDAKYILICLTIKMSIKRNSW